MRHFPTYVNGKKVPLPPSGAYVIVLDIRKPRFQPKGVSMGVIFREKPNMLNPAGNSANLQENREPPLHRSTSSLRSVSTVIMAAMRINEHLASRILPNSILERTHCDKFNKDADTLFEIITTPGNRSDSRAG